MNEYHSYPADVERAEQPRLPPFSIIRYPHMSSIQRNMYLLKPFIFLGFVRF